MESRWQKGCSTACPAALSSGALTLTPDAEYATICNQAVSQPLLLCESAAAVQESSFHEVRNRWVMAPLPREHVDDESDR